MEERCLPHNHGQKIEHGFDHMPKEEDFQTVADIFKQLCDGKLNTPIKDAIWRVVPTTVDMAKPMIAKALAALAAVVALIVIAVKFL